MQKLTHLAHSPLYTWDARPCWGYNGHARVCNADLGAIRQLRVALVGATQPWALGTVRVLELASGTTHTFACHDTLSAQQPELRMTLGAPAGAAAIWEQVRLFPSLMRSTSNAKLIYLLPIHLIKIHLRLCVFHIGLTLQASVGGYC
jgi:hypothetical protein